MSNKTDSKHGMSLVVKTAAGWLAGAILLFGLYLVVYGHDTPGGGFAGGVAIAGGYILLTLARGQAFAMRGLGERPMAVLASMGAILFLGLAVAGLIVGDVFFESFIAPPEEAAHGPFTAVFVLLCEVGVALVVAMSLFGVFTVLARTRIVRGQDAGRDVASSSPEGR